jgi:hypothetical protein
MARMHVNQAENEGREGETAEAERGRIGELAEMTFVWLGVKVSCRGRENGALVLGGSIVRATQARFDIACFVCHRSEICIRYRSGRVGIKRGGVLGVLLSHGA